MLKFLFSVTLITVGSVITVSAGIFVYI